MKAYICDRHKLLQLITYDYKNEHGVPCPERISVKWIQKNNTKVEQRKTSLKIPKG